MPEQVTIWVTKYALTQGIYPVLATASDHNTGVMTVGEPLNYGTQTFFAGQYEMTKEAAKAKVIQLAMKKIKLLEKQHAFLLDLVMEMESDLANDQESELP